MARQSAHTLRIIGGIWRGRRFAVETADGLRPTPDRVRETLFNWLMPRIAGARCLDLFAGTGALGLEALSRGAGHVTFIERDPAATRALRHTLATLACQTADVRQADALTTAPTLHPGFDIIFIDPPFAADRHAQALAAIRPLVKPGTQIYLEYAADRQTDMDTIRPHGWQALRNKRAGRVGYGLWQAQEAT